MLNNKKSWDLVKYVIYNPKLKPNERIKVVLIADLHNYLKGYKKTKELSDVIISRKPHHIVIAGDIIQGKKWEKDKSLCFLSMFLKNISEFAPVFISQGNHDLVGLNSKNKEQRMKQFKKLEEINPGRIYALENNIVTYDNFKILGYTPDRQIINRLEIQEHGIAHDMFIREYMQKGRKITKKDSKYIVEFVGHNPHLIARSENGIGLEDLKYIDTFYSGHLHNGYRKSSTIKKNPDRYLDYGYAEKPYSRDKNGKIIWKTFTPLFYSKISLCRGVVYVDDNSQRRVLQLRNNHFYINNSNEYNKDLWDRIEEEKAHEFINDNSLHALVITGGIRKFFGLSIPNDDPEITEVTYLGEGE